jgi:hypothetical protein
MIGTLIVKRKTADGFEALNRHDLDTYLKDWGRTRYWSSLVKSPV